MASLLASSRPSVFYPNPNLIRCPSHRRPLPLLSFFSAPPHPRLSSSAVSGDGRQQEPRWTSTGNPSEVDEWGERSRPEAPSQSDPPNDEDEWGREPAASATGITDEWGEKAEMELEAPSQPDPRKDEDKWGREVGDMDSLSGNASGPRASNKLEDLKRCVVDSLYGTELGFRASGEVRAEIFELVSQLEAENPTPAPTKRPELLDGNWILLYTAFSELLPLLAVGATPLLKVKKISQEIDSRSMTIVNATTLSSPFAAFSFSATASFEVRSPSRIQVQFKEGSFQPPEISSSVDLPENIDIFGRKVDLSPIQQSLNPVQDAAVNITRTISGQPPLKVPIPGDRASSWLLITYLDEDFRISRGDGGLYILAKEGSPLLGQLS